MKFVHSSAPNHSYVQQEARGEYKNTTKKFSSSSGPLFFENARSIRSFAAVFWIALNPIVTQVSAFTIVKRTNSHDIKRIVFGTAALSKAEKPMDLLDEAWDKGFRRFDLARTYGAGESEKIFGEWMVKANIDRSSIDIITKGGMGKDKYGNPDRPLLTREGLQEEVEMSLASLKTDFVDMYMFHRDDPRIPASVFVDWANELVKSGKIKRWGVSNWSFDRFREAHSHAIDNDLVPPSGNSPQFSLAVPECEVWPTTHSISGPECYPEIKWYEDNGIELLCWEVLAKGFMANPNLWPEDEIDPCTFNDPVEIGTDNWRVQRIQRAYCNSENYRRRRLAVELAKNCGCNLSQVAVMYPLTMGKHVSVIFGTTKTNHLDDMVSLQHLYLDDDAMFQLRSGPGAPKVLEADLPENIPSFGSRVSVTKKTSSVYVGLTP